MDAPGNAAYRFERFPVQAAEVSLAGLRRRLDGLAPDGWAVTGTAARERIIA